MGQCIPDIFELLQYDVDTQVQLVPRRGDLPSLPSGEPSGE